MTAQPITTLQNRRFTLLRRPNGMVQRTDFEFSTVPASEPGPGEVLVRVDYLSIDPAMRGWMNEGRSYIAPVGIGEVMRAAGIGTVVGSRTADVQEGASVQGVFGVQNYALARPSELTPVDTTLAPAPAHLG